MGSISRSHTPSLRVKRLGGWFSKGPVTGLADRTPRFRAFLRAFSLEIVACPFKRDVFVRFRLSRDNIDRSLPTLWWAGVVGSRPTLSDESWVA